MKDFQQFVYRALVITVVLGLCSFFLHQAFPLFVSKVWWIALGYVLLATVVLMWYLCKVEQNFTGRFDDRQQRKLVMAHQKAKTLKLLSYLVVIGLFVFVRKEDSLGFLLVFMAYYLVFSFVEVQSLRSLIRRKQEQANDLDKN